MYIREMQVSIKLAPFAWKSKLFYKNKQTYYAMIKKEIIQGYGLKSKDELNFHLGSDNEGRPVIVCYLDKRPAFG